MPELNDTNMFENLNLTQTYVRELIRTELGFNQVVKVELINKNLNIYLKNGDSIVIPMEEPFINEYSSALMSLVANLNNNNIINAYVNSQGLFTVIFDNGLEIVSDFSYLNESINNITGNLEDLTTKAKTSLVASINEIKNKIKVITTEDYDVPTNGIADAYTNMQKAVNAAVGKKLIILSGEYNLLGGSIVVPSNSHIVLEKGAVIRQPNKGEASVFVINPNSHNITIEGGKLIGAYEGGVPMWQGDTNTTLTNGDSWVHMEDNIGIHIRGRYYQRENLGYTYAQMQALTDETINVIVRNVEITGFGQSGIIADQVTRCHFEYNYIHQCGRDGIRFYGAYECSANNNHIYELSPGYGGDYPNWNVYGIAATRLYGTNIVPDTNTTIGRRSNHVLLDGNFIENCHTWKGLDTHGGLNLRYINNKIKNCYISIGLDTGGYGTRGFTPPTNIVLANNTIEHDEKARYKRAGITAYSSGATQDGPTALGDGLTITGNTFTNVGGKTTDGVISISQWNNVTITGNVIKNFTRTGVAVTLDSHDITVTGNIFINPRPYYGVTIANGGSGYTQTPKVLVNGVENPNFKVIPKLTNGVITLVDIVYIGNDFIDVPTLTVVSVEGNGTGGQLTAVKYNPSIMLSQTGTLSGTFSGNAIRHDDTSFTLDGVYLGQAPTADSQFAVANDNVFSGAGTVRKVRNLSYAPFSSMGKLPIGFARYRASDNLILAKHPNITGVSKTSTGVYVVTLANNPSTATNNMIPMATVINIANTTCRATVTSLTEVTVYVTDLTGVAKDGDFSLVVFSAEL